MKPSTLLLLGGVAAAAAATWLFSRGSEESSSATRTPPVPEPLGGEPPDPLVEGLRGDPEVEAAYSKLRDSLVSMLGSVPVPVEDLVVLPKAAVAPGETYVAIPPPELWERMAATLAHVVRPLSHAVPVEVASGYRPPWYNEQVGGAPASRHQWFDAVDLRPRDDGDREAFGMFLANLYATRGDALRMGLGIYGNAARAHVDVGWKKRAWENAPDWLAKV